MSSTIDYGSLSGQLAPDVYPLATMLRKFLQLALLVVVPLTTLLWLLNTGNETSLIYGDSSAPRLLELDAKRNGDIEIQLDDAMLMSKNFLDFEFDQEQRFKTQEFDYDLTCIKTRPSSKVKQLACEFDNKRGERLRLVVKRQGFIKVGVVITRV